LGRYRRIITVTIIVLVAGVIRIYFAVNCKALPDYSDMALYNSLAMSDGIPTVPPPGYPIFLRAIYSIFGAYNYKAVFVIQALVSSLTVLIIYWVSSRIAGFKAGVISAIITCFYPFFIAYNLTTLTESLSLLIVALVMASFQLPSEKKFKEPLTAFIMCLGYLIRPPLMYFWPGVLICQKRKVAFIAATAILLVPWITYTTATGQTSNRIARALYKSYNEKSNGKVYVNVPDTKLKSMDLSSGEYIRGALEFMKNNKMQTLDILLGKVSVIFSAGYDSWVLKKIIGDEHYMKTIFRHVYLPIMIFGFVGLIRLCSKRNRHLAIMLFSYLFFNILTAIFKVRYRLMIEPILIVYASILLGGFRIPGRGRNEKRV